MAYTLKTDNQKESFKELLSESSSLELESIYKNNYLKESTSRSNISKIENLEKEEESLTEDQQISLDRFIFDAMDSVTEYRRETEEFPVVEKQNYKIETAKKEAVFKTSGQIIDVKPLGKKEAVIEVIRVPKNEQKQEEITKPKVETPEGVIRNFKELLSFITNGGSDLNLKVMLINKSNKNRIDEANEIFKKISFLFKNLSSLRSIEINNIETYFDVNFELKNGSIFPYISNDNNFGLSLGLAVMIYFQYIKNSLSEADIADDKSSQTFFKLGAGRINNFFNFKSIFTENELIECLNKRDESSIQAQEDKEIIISNKFLFNDSGSFLFAEYIKKKITYENVEFNLTDNKTILINIIETTIKNNGGFLCDKNFLITGQKSSIDNVVVIYRFNLIDGRSIISSLYCLKRIYENKEYYIVGGDSNESTLTNLKKYFSFYIKEDNTIVLYDESERDLFFNTLKTIESGQEEFSNMVEAYNKYLTLIDDYNYEYTLTNDELYNTGAINIKDFIKFSTPQKPSLEYEKIIDEVLAESRKAIKGNGVGVTQIFNTSNEEAIENANKILDMAKINGWNDYESYRNNIQLVETSPEEIEYFKDYNYEINSFFPEGLPEKIIEFELPFNWCGHCIGYFFSKFLKKEIRKKNLVSTFRMFREYGVPQNAIQPYNAKNPPEDNWKKEEIVNNRAYIVRADFVWMRKKSFIKINKINKKTSLSQEEKDAEFESVLKEFQDIFNVILKKGDIVSCLPDTKNRKKIYGQHFSLITGEVYYDYGLDGEIHFYVPVIEGNFLGSVVEGVRDVFDIVVRYRFKEEDFVNFNNVQQPVEKNSNDEIIFRRK